MLLNDWQRKALKIITSTQLLLSEPLLSINLTFTRMCLRFIAYFLFETLRSLDSLHFATGTVKKERLHQRQQKYQFPL